MGARNGRVALRPRDRLPVLAGLRQASTGIRAAKSTPTTISTASASSRTSGCAAAPCAAGCRRPTPTSRSIIFETGGSTGVPKSRISIDDFRIDYEAFSATLPDEAFPRGADWLMLGPSGPRRLRLAVEHLAQYRGGICFMMDLDPRWVIKLIKRGKIDKAERYKQHVVEQALTLLRAHDNIQCMFTTPKLLEALCEKVSLKKDRHQGRVLRRHGDDAAVPSLRRGGIAGRRLLRAHLRQHADGPGGPQAARGRRQLRGDLLSARAARHDRSGGSGPARSRSSNTARPAACG